MGVVIGSSWGDGQPRITNGQSIWMFKMTKGLEAALGTEQIIGKFGISYPVLGVTYTPNPMWRNPRNFKAHETSPGVVDYLTFSGDKDVTGSVQMTFRQNPGEYLLKNRIEPFAFNPFEGEDGRHLGEKLFKDFYALASNVTGAAIGSVMTAPSPVGLAAGLIGGTIASFPEVFSIIATLLELIQRDHPGRDPELVQGEPSSDKLFTLPGEPIGESILIPKDTASPVDMLEDWLQTATPAEKTAFCEEVRSYFFQTMDNFWLDAGINPPPAPDIDYCDWFYDKLDLHFQSIRRKNILDGGYLSMSKEEYFAGWNDTLSDRFDYVNYQGTQYSLSEVIYGLAEKTSLYDFPISP